MKKSTRITLLSIPLPILLGVNSVILMRSIDKGFPFLIGISIASIIAASFGIYHTHKIWYNQGKIDGLNDPKKDLDAKEE